MCVYEMSSTSIDVHRSISVLGAVHLRSRLRWQRQVGVRRVRSEWGASEQFANCGRFRGGAIVVAIRRLHCAKLQGTLQYQRCQLCDQQQLELWRCSYKPQDYVRYSEFLYFFFNWLLTCRSNWQYISVLEKSHGSPLHSRSNIRVSGREWWDIVLANAMERVVSERGVHARRVRGRERCSFGKQC